MTDEAVLKFYQTYDAYIRQATLNKLNPILDEPVIPIHSNKKVANYLESLLNDFAIIETGLSKVSNIEKFIAFDKTKFKIEDLGLETREYRSYHTENFQIRLSSLLDFLNHFINQCFRLGIPDKWISINALIENKNIEETKIAIILKKLDTAFSSTKADRNKIIHRGKYVSKTNLLEFPESIRITLDENQMQILDSHNLKETNKLLNEWKDLINKYKELSGEILIELIPIIDNQILFLETT